MTTQAAARNGPKATSLLIVNPHINLDEIDVGVKPRTAAMTAGDDRGKSMQTDTIAPRTNAETTAAKPYKGPRSQPIPSASFASPSPIHVPRETNQSAAKGSAKNGPASTVQSRFVIPRNGAKNCEASASAARRYTHRSGMMPCFMS